MKITLQAIRALLNKLFSRLDVYEAQLGKLSEKFKGLKGQKRIKLDLLTGECSMAFDDVMAMDAEDIQSSLRLIGQLDTDGMAHEFSPICVDKSSVTFNGINFCSITFMVASGNMGPYSGLPAKDSGVGAIICYEWSRDSLVRKNDFKLPVNYGLDNMNMLDGSIPSVSTLVCCVSTVADDSAILMRFDHMPVDGLLLASQSYGSARRFLLTIDDTMELKITDVTGN